MICLRKISLSEYKQKGSVLLEIYILFIYSNASTKKSWTKHACTCKTLKENCLIFGKLLISYHYRQQSLISWKDLLNRCKIICGNGKMTIINQNSPQLSHSFPSYKPDRQGSKPTVSLRFLGPGSTLRKSIHEIISRYLTRRELSGVWRKEA